LSIDQPGSDGYFSRAAIGSTCLHFHLGHQLVVLLCHINLLRSLLPPDELVTLVVILIWLSIVSHSTDAKTVGRHGLATGKAGGIAIGFPFRHDSALDVL
jgi:hypothetical protein